MLFVKYRNLKEKIYPQFYDEEINKVWKRNKKRKDERLKDIGQ